MHLCVMQMQHNSQNIHFYQEQFVFCSDGYTDLVEFNVDRLIYSQRHFYTACVCESSHRDIFTLCVCAHHMGFCLNPGTLVGLAHSCAIQLILISHSIVKLNAMV